MIKSLIMAEYRDYGYTNNEPDHTFFYLQPALFSMLDKNINRWILDLGCGNGYLVSHLVKEGYNAYGTDASEKGIAIAKQEYADRFFVQDIGKRWLRFKNSGRAFVRYKKIEYLMGERIGKVYLYHPFVRIVFYGIREERQYIPAFSLFQVIFYGNVPSVYGIGQTVFTII